MSELALQCIREAKEKHYTSLQLGNCGLQVLPAELFELEWLEELNLSEGRMFDFKQNRWVNLYDYNRGGLGFVKNKNEPNNFNHLAVPVGLFEIFKAKIPDWERLSNLKVLILNGPIKNKWELRDLSPLRHLTNLKVLSIENLQVKDLSPLRELKHLEQLFLRNTYISDLSPLEGLSQLQFLDINLTKVRNLSPLRNLKKLEKLYIHRTDVHDLEPLRDLEQLSDFDASFTKIQDLSSLEGLRKLITLIVSINEIRDLNPLKGLEKLKKLNVSNT